MGAVHRDRKLDEAQCCYVQMSVVQQNPEHFAFKLSAFLTAARSVLQYAGKEAKLKPGGQSWYDTTVANHGAIKFFKGKRDVNAHGKPVGPQELNLGIEIAMRIGLGEPVEIAIFEGEKLVGHRRFESPPEPALEPSHATVRFTDTLRWRYRFTDWPGTGDVIGLCRSYLDALKIVVADGRSRGFLS
jgi:hypothetical protein